MKKSLKKNYIYNLSYQILTMVLPLIVTPYLSRVLGAEKIGVYSFTLSILSYFTLFGCMGINLYGQREIASVQENKKKRSEVFYELVILKAISISISFLFFAIINFNDATYGIYYKILTIELLSNIFDITWFFQGMEDFKNITFRNIFVRIVSTILIFLFVKDKNDLILYFLITAISNFLGYSVLWINLKKYIVSFKNIKLNIKKHIKPSILLFIPQIAIQIYTVLDKTMLGLILKEMSKVGFYEQSQKIVRMLLMLITALGTVMIPRISNLYANNQQEELNKKINEVFNIVSLITFPICFGLIAISSNFVPWFYGDEFLPIIRLLCIFSFLLIAIGFNNITGMQYLIPTKKQNIFTISVVIGAVVNLILNAILIPLYKDSGAAIATVIAEFIIFFVQVFYLRKIFDFKKIFLNNYKYCIFSVLMSLIVYYVGVFIKYEFISILVQVIIGTGIYFVMLLISKDKLIMSLVKIMLNKIKKVKK